MERQSTKKNKKVFQDVLYAQCWEDPQIDREAFNITSDDVVFSITSGGCNVLTFLIDNPQKIIALDLNPYQNYLLELKISAFRNLSYEKLLEFVGVIKSCDRMELYNIVKKDLSENCRNYWDTQKEKILSGIIHCGRYEKYMRLLGRTLNILLGQSLISNFFEIKDEDRRFQLYQHKVNNLSWWLFTRILLSRAMMSFLFDKAFFKYLDRSFSFGKHFEEKVMYAFTQLPITENYFLSYILLNRYYDEKFLPVYLRKENFELIKSRIERVEIITNSCENYFSKIHNDFISKFNFTNIFEWMSVEKYRSLLEEIIRVGKDKSIMTYRNLLVYREHPPEFEGQIKSLKTLSIYLHKKDLSFVYDNYVVEQITKE
jgi:S-adenosylmethionine-diacylglycerol 3-amino-3-carboxypropyl transferase